MFMLPGIQIYLSVFIFCFGKVDFLGVNWNGSIALWKKEAISQGETNFKQVLAFRMP